MSQNQQTRVDGWTEEEDLIVINTVKEYKSKNRTLKAAYIAAHHRLDGKRTVPAIQTRWKTTLRPNIENTKNKHQDTTNTEQTSEITLDDITRMIERYKAQSHDEEIAKLKQRIAELERELECAQDAMKPVFNAARELLKIEDIREIAKINTTPKKWRIDQNGVVDRFK